MEKHTKTNELRRAKLRRKVGEIGAALRQLRPDRQAAFRRDVLRAHARRG